MRDQEGRGGLKSQNRKMKPPLSTFMKLLDLGKYWFTLYRLSATNLYTVVNAGLRKVWDPVIHRP